MKTLWIDLTDGSSRKFHSDICTWEFANIGLVVRKPGETTYFPYSNVLQILETEDAPV